MDKFKYSDTMFFSGVWCHVLANSRRDLSRLRSMARADWSAFKHPGRYPNLYFGPNSCGDSICVRERPSGSVCYVYRTRKIMYRSGCLNVTEYGTDTSWMQFEWCKENEGSWG